MTSYAPIYRKSESDCSPITLIMRKYYTPERAKKATEYREAKKDEINSQMRERYHNDPEFREKVLARRRANYHKKKQLIQITA